MVNNLKNNMTEPFTDFSSIQKTFSSDNKNEIKEFNRMENIDGKIIKVMLITKSGFQYKQRYNNVRQIHFMEPGSNLNEIEEVLGSIDSFLPIRKRNIEIYLHASRNIHRTEEECVDLSCYRIMDKECSKMDELHQFLSECSLECLFKIKGSDLSINELSESIYKKKISIELSSNNKKSIPYQFSSNFFTNNDKTKFHFMNTDLIYEKEREFFLKKTNHCKDKIEKILCRLFQEKDVYNRKELIERINQKQNLSIRRNLFNIKISNQ